MPHDSGADTMEELIIYQKMQELLEYGYVALRQFPKSEKYALGADIKSTMYKVLQYIIIANKRYYKKNTLQELDIAHEVLRRQIELAKTLRFLPFKKYELIIMRVDEIGRLIGGWKKRLRNSG
jgi:four helix bundle protein